MSIYYLTIHQKYLFPRRVNSLKGVSSRHRSENNIQNEPRYYWKGGLWSPSYFAGSWVGAPLSIIKQYIEQQNRPL